MSYKLERTPNTLRILETLLTELIDSEETYIEKLSLIIRYLEEFRKKKPQVPVPDDLRSYKGLFVFCNVEDIYRWHKEVFMLSLVKYRQCSSQLGNAFVSSETHFHMYCKYCNNVPIAEFIVTEHLEYFNQLSQAFGHKPGELLELLKIPTLRLAEYRILLSRIAEHLKMLEADWESVNDAYNMIEKIFKHTTDFNALEGMKNYEDNIYEHGKLIFHNYLTCKYEGKTRRHYVILFKRLLVFADKQETRDKNAMPSYTYRLQIPMNKLILKELPGHKFTLRSTDPQCEDLCIVCNGESDQLHYLWLQQIKSQLKMQTDLIAALQNPTAQYERQL
uniref:DH domain-containing protein n=1 Tax=Stomoxys calcitrans TaxID=35570 RepID=A0A1I8Q1G8_STOCA